MKAPNVIALGDGADRMSLIAIDLPKLEDALALAKLLANHTGRTVTLRDEHGVLLETVCPSVKH